jgi:hypothetical protein
MECIQFTRFQILPLSLSYNLHSQQFEISKHFTSDKKSQYFSMSTKDRFENIVVGGIYVRGKLRMVVV